MSVTNDAAQAFSLCGFGFHELPPLVAVGPEDPNDPFGDGKRWPPMLVGRRCARCGQDLAGLDMNPWFNPPGQGAHRRKIDWRSERRYAITVIKITLFCCAVLLGVGLVLTATLT